MKTALSFSFLLLASLSLANCSYFDAGPEANANANTVDMTAKQQPTPPVETLISGNTDGSVEIYPLTGSPSTPALAPQSSLSAPDGAFSYGDSQYVETVSAVPVGANVPRVYSGDPSVDVFPLDGSAPSPQPSMQPPQQFNVVNANTGAPAAVYFDHGSATLDNTDYGVIDTLVANNNMARGISVEGFASVESSIQDPVKRKIANLKMSMKRAIAVSNALIDKGVPAELLTTVAHGENRAAASAEQSRRVEIRGL